MLRKEVGLVAKHGPSVGRNGTQAPRCDAVRLCPLATGFFPPPPRDNHRVNELAEHLSRRGPVFYDADSQLVGNLRAVNHSPPGPALHAALPGSA